MTLPSLADSALGVSRFRAAQSRGDRLGRGLWLVGQSVLLLTVVLGVLLPRPEVPQLSFRVAMVVILIGLVLGLARITSPFRAVPIGHRFFGVVLAMVSGAVYLTLFIHAPNSSLIVGALSGLVLLGLAATRAGVELSVARTRERKPKA